jgi:hypothetical protein
MTHILFIDNCLPTLIRIILTLIKINSCLKDFTLLLMFSYLQTKILFLL